MKRLIFVLLAGLLASCGVPQPQYIQSPTGQQMVVVQDNSGSQFLVDYLMFQSLGYGGCVSYYHAHPGYYRMYDRNAYSSWHAYSPSMRTPSPAPAIRDNGFRSNGNSAPVQFRNTSPSPTRTNGFSSTGTRVTFRNTTSGTRSSGFRRR
jgi:hypothetical protein